MRNHLREEIYMNRQRAAEEAGSIRPVRSDRSVRLLSTRRAFLQSAAGAATLSFVPNRAFGKTSPPPNLLLLLSDDHTFRALGAVGNHHIKTPTLDALAASGTYFSHCYVSNPICTPSRAALLTGQYGFSNGVTFFNKKIRPESPRLPRLLNEQGYTTAFIGKWHNDGRPLDHGFLRMRHTFLGGMHEHDSIPVVQGANDEKLLVPKNPSELFTDGAIELLGELPEPWCLFVWYTAPHDPRHPPGNYARMYDEGSIPLPPNFMPEPPPHHQSTLDIRDEKLLPRPLDPQAIRHETAQYYGLISHLDAQIARLLEALDRHGQRSRTLIAFGGDNGLTLGAHGLLGKQTMYEEGVRVPLMLSGPGVPRGKTQDKLVDLMDVMPTFLEAAGAPVPDTVQGCSLLARHEHRPRSPRIRPRDTIFGHYDDLFRMVRRDRFKLIHTLKPDSFELFNLEEDPYELQDLSASPEHARRLHSLREALQA
ncbi:MAG: sulfatase-like hydrolase/transferase [Candidatus Hydrogenedentes bacterium]|nr:sulfatase-like hydrolase/transferase [Candidatus Hydrogenedentota bacterium]